jgi:hypothetical protein
MPAGRLVVSSHRLLASWAVLFATACMHVQRKVGDRVTEHTPSTAR